MSRDQAAGAGRPTSSRSSSDRVAAADSDDEVAARIALTTLRLVGPARLRWLLAGRTALETLAELRAGRLHPDSGDAPPGVRRELVERWMAEARTLDPGGLLARHRDLGLQLLTPGHPDWPFGDDPDPPAVLYVDGHLEALRSRHRVAIVGTRRCTDVGRGVAVDLGRDLTGRGIGVVSGLALGIDGAAHRGALAAANGTGDAGLPLAVVANGLDRVTPPSHRKLAAEVAGRGAVISETPLGTGVERWRFPARNRLIAGLAQVVVVVESHERGGALITVDEANDRGITVMAVPGSVRSSASVGTNRLLVDGAAPACSPAEVVAVLDGLGLGPVGRTPRSSSAATGDPGWGRTRPLPFDPEDPLERRVVDEIGAAPLTIDRLVAATGADLESVLLAVHRLAGRGLVRQVGATVCLAG